jgi:hypothetical protein
VKKSDKIKDNANMSELIKLDFLISLGNPASVSKYPRHLPFNNKYQRTRGVDKVLGVLISFREIEILMPLKEDPDKTKIFLKVQAFSYIKYYLKKRLETENSAP